MIRAYSVDAVRAAEARAMAELPDGELMRRASVGLAELSAARLAERGGVNVVGLVGGGDNGGDTLLALASLSDAGFACAAVLLASQGRDGVHTAALAHAERAGVTVAVATDGLDTAGALVGEAEVVLDGIVGIGGRPGLHEPARRLRDAIDDDAWVVAVDLASGLDPAGEVGTDDTVWADETVTFGPPKPAHLLPAGEAATGRLTVVDIGLDLAGTTPVVERLTADDVIDLWPVPGPSDDKYSRGVLGVVAGGESYTGAAVLCVTAAAEAGAGMIRYVGTPNPTALVRAAVPEAVMGEGRVQAWLVGPGFDPEAGGDDAREQLRVAREALASDLPVVLDAGGLALIDGPRSAPTLITPHAGEAATLLTRLEASDGGAVEQQSASGEGQDEVTADDVTAEPLRHARRLAALTNATVLLKGSTTLVVAAGHDNPVRSQADAPPWLATAGAGDVLAGVVGALLASGLSPRDAGSLGALVHGTAARQASGGGPLRSLAVAHGVAAAVRDLLRRDRPGQRRPR